MPGSLSFYLWQDSGKSATDVVDELIDIAMAVHSENRQTTFDNRKKLIEHSATRG
jgi:hypothetical protein